MDISPAERFPQHTDLCDMEGVMENILQEFQNKPVSLPKLSCTSKPPFPPPSGADGLPQSVPGTSYDAVRSLKN